MQPITYLTEWAYPYYESARFDLASSGVPDSFMAVPNVVRQTAWSDANGIEAIEEARSRVAGHYGVSPQSVTLTFGGSQGLFMTAFVLAQRGPAAVVESPVYEPLHRNFEALGREVRFLERPPEDGYRLRTTIEAAASLARGASCLVLTNPNNPSGAYDDRETLAELARAIAPTWLVVNEAYLPLVPGSATAFGAADNICVISTLTKAYGISIPRFGWIVAPEDLSASLRESIFYLHGRYSGTVAALAVPIMERLPECLAGATAHIAGRHDTVNRAFAASTRVRWLRPQGRVMIALMTVEGVTDDRAFARALLETREVITAPGTYFRAPGTLRLSIGARSDQFTEGFARLLEFAESYHEENHQRQ